MVFDWARNWWSEHPRTAYGIVVFFVVLAIIGAVFVATPAGGYLGGSQGTTTSTTSNPSGQKTTITTTHQGGGTTVITTITTPVLTNIPRCAGVRLVVGPGPFYPTGGQYVVVNGTSNGYYWAWVVTCQ